MYLLFIVILFLIGFMRNFFIMESPDLAITEAAVGAGVTSVLLFLTLKKVNVLKGKKDE